MRGFAAFGSVVINGKLVIAGGNNRNRLSSIEMVAPNARSKTLDVSLPVAFGYSCIVPWDADTFMVIGGCTGSGCDKRETYFITPNNNTVSSGPKLLKGRSYVACHDMVVNGEEFIIVVGGHSGQERTIEVLSKANFKDGWKMGKKYDVV